MTKVTTMQGTFNGASKFTGTGLNSWITTSVTSLAYTFQVASEMNTDLSGWNVDKVVNLAFTFKSASKFEGVGLHSWDISKVKDMDDIFASATSLTSCSKFKIVDAWKSSSVFVATTYDTDWIADKCAIEAPMPSTPPTDDGDPKLSKELSGLGAAARAITALATGATTSAAAAGTTTNTTTNSTPVETAQTRTSQLISGISDIIAAAAAATATTTANINANTSNVTGDSTPSIVSPARASALLGAVVDALATVTANQTQITVAAASETATVLAEATELAKQLNGTFDEETTSKLVDTVSAALGARGLTPPDSAIRSIPAILDAVAGLQANTKETISAASEVVSLISYPEARPSAWLAVPAAEPEPGCRQAVPSGGGNCGDSGSSSTSSGEESDAGSSSIEFSRRPKLDAPVRVRTVEAFPSQSSSSSSSPSWSERPSKITLLQFSGARNPFWPSAESSTDIISLTISPERSSLPPGGSSSMRRLSADKAAADKPTTINVTFAVTSHLWEDTSSSSSRRALNGDASGRRRASVKDAAVTYEKQDACGENSSHTTRTVSFRGTDKRMWCAMWNENKGTFGEWDSAGCSVVDIVDVVENATGAIATRSSNETRRGTAPATTTSTVHCLCVVQIPPKKLGIDVVLGIVDYSFSRFPLIFDVSVPFKASIPAILVCVVPLLLYAIMIAYLKRRQRLFYRQRRGRELSVTSEGKFPSFETPKNDKKKPDADDSKRSKSRRRSVAHGVHGAINIMLGVKQLSTRTLNSARPTPIKKGDIVAIRGGGGDPRVCEIGGADWSVSNPARANTEDAATDDEHEPRGRCDCLRRGILWWWWQAMKRNHDTLAPFLAPEDPAFNEGKTRVYLATMMIVKYAGKLPFA